MNPREFLRMNKTEQRFAARLASDRSVASWDFECITFTLSKPNPARTMTTQERRKLLKACRYTPDFFVVTDDGKMICYETKGQRREDAIVKIKAAAEKFPWFLFILVEHKRGQWVFEEV